MKKIAALMAITFLCACTTPKTMLVNNKTGQIESCGGSATGSMVGGVVGYHIQKSNDAKCEADLLANGFKRMGAVSTSGGPTTSK